MPAKLISISNGLNFLATDPPSCTPSVALLSWLTDLIWTKKTLAVPAGPWPDGRAAATIVQGGLVLSVYGSELGSAILLTAGIATRKNHGEPLWRVMTALPGAMREAPRVQLPWCAVAFHTASDYALAFGPLLQLCADAWLKGKKDIVKRRPKKGATYERRTIATSQHDSVFAAEEMLPVVCSDNVSPSGRTTLPLLTGYDLILAINP